MIFLSSVLCSFEEVDLMTPCPYGCCAGHAVCDEGKRLLEEGMYLQSLFPPVLPLPLSEEYMWLLGRFWAVGDLWMKHIGCYVPDRLS